MRMVYFNLLTILVKWGIYTNTYPYHIKKFHNIQISPSKLILFHVSYKSIKITFSKILVKFFFLIKKAQISFLIFSAESWPLNTELFNVWKSQFPYIWLGMILNISVSEVKFLILSSGSLDNSYDSFENSSVNLLSYHQCSNSWFDRVDFLLILAILSFS